MQRAVKPKTSDDLTEQEIMAIKQFDADKQKGKTKVYTLEELIKELHE
ncbi:MAG: hypothetical protein ACREBA_08160 [Nitrosotalea sp.]